MFRILTFFLLITSSFLEGTEEKKRICLNMIVKNESHVITRCLSSVKPLIDSWLIVDTGSTDGTQEVIRNYFKDIPGELVERPWVNFEHNREEALQLAKKSPIAHADYILIMDADDFLSVDKDFKLPDLTLDSYMIMSHAASIEYFIARLVKSDLDWHWHGVLHEYIHAPDAKTSMKLTGVEVFCTSEGARSKDPVKYLKDAKILEEAIKKEPHNVRYHFYLAQSYYCAGDLEKGKEYYAKRAEMGGWPEEVFWSLFQVARLSDQLKENPKIVEESYLKAFKYRPSRIEPLYYLVFNYRLNQDFKKGYEIARIAKQMALPSDILFVEKWIYDYGMLFEYSIAAYWVGKYEECDKACDQLLAMKDLPEIYKTYVVQNKEFAQQKIHETNLIQKIDALFPVENN